MNRQPYLQDRSPQPGETYYYHPGMSGPFYQPGGTPPFDPETEQRKAEQKAYAKQITRKGQWIGLALLFVQILALIVVEALPLLVDMLFPGASASNSVFYDAVEYAVYSPVCILLSFWLAAKFCKAPLTQLIPFEKHPLGLSVGCMLACFWGIVGGNFVAGMVGTAFPQVEEFLESASGATPTTPVELLLNILYVAAIPALVEEFSFRGVVMGLLRPYGDRFALLTSALLFALLHGNLIQIPFAFCVGVVLAYATIRTGSIVPAIIVHFVNNATSCLLTYFEQPLTELFGQAYGLVLYAFWGLLGLAGFLIVRVGYRRQSLTACLQPYVGCISAGRRTGSFFKAGFLIAAMAVYLLTALIMLLP